MKNYSIVKLALKYIIRLKFTPRKYLMWNNHIIKTIVKLNQITRYNIN